MLFKLTEWGIGNTAVLYALAIVPILVLAQNAAVTGARAPANGDTMASAGMTAAVLD